jgi:methionine sulfoxide reductase catalytic subunit
VDKGDPARLAHFLRLRPWTVEVDGLVNTAAHVDADDLIRFAPLEERI